MKTSSYYDPITRKWTTDPKYQEILKLDRMLNEACIPHVLETCNDGWRLYYPTTWYEPEYVMDVDEHFGSYGSWEDKLEINGLLTQHEEQVDYVAGFLDAEDVFNRIKEHWEGTHEYIDIDKHHALSNLELESFDIDMTPEEYAALFDLESDSDDVYMSPEEFTDEMIRIHNETCADAEIACRSMQELMCDLLVNLGYGEGVDIFLDLVSEVEHE